VLSWVERDVLMGLGDERAAEAAHDHIRKLLREERDQALLALVERRFSERMVSWGRRRSAAQASREARTLYRQMDDKAGQAVTTRGSADLAVLAGEQHGAETLYEQVMTVPSSPVERMNRQLGFAGLQMLRGEYTAASGLLEHITGPDLTYPVVQANLALRRAELALRLGRHAEAEAQALEARRHYGRVGERVALGRVQRLRGDIAALAGRPAQAAAHYQEAMHWQLRMQDLVGFDRSLAHLAELERSAGDPQRAAALDQRRASIRELLQREEG
jgi:tetratricopeptide (TPR) repeat protein